MDFAQIIDISRPETHSQFKLTIFMLGSISSTSLSPFLPNLSSKNKKEESYVVDKLFHKKN